MGGDVFFQEVEEGRWGDARDNFRQCGNGSVMGVEEGSRVKDGDGLGWRKGVGSKTETGWGRGGEGKEDSK